MEDKDTDPKNPNLWGPSAWKALYDNLPNKYDRIPINSGTKMSCHSHVDTTGHGKIKVTYDDLPSLEDDDVPSLEDVSDDDVPSLEDESDESDDDLPGLVDIYSSDSDDKSLTEEELHEMIKQLKKENKMLKDKLESDSKQKKIIVVDELEEKNPPIGQLMELTGCDTFYGKPKKSKSQKIKEILKELYGDSFMDVLLGKISPTEALDHTKLGKKLKEVYGDIFEDYLYGKISSEELKASTNNEILLKELLGDNYEDIVSGKITNPEILDKSPYKHLFKILYQDPSEESDDDDEDVENIKITINI